jgi:prepilin-type processing-associated H-X9-DG protein
MELVVTVSIIAVLAMLVLPAVQAAREAARRAQCVNNLKQLGIAVLSYADGFGSLPPGRIKSYDPRYAGPNPPCTSTIVDKSIEIFVLPYLEQAAVFNAINQSLTIVGAENSTVHSVAITSLACPDDPLSGTVRELVPGQLAAYGVPDPALMVFTSYAGSMGSSPVTALPLSANGCTVMPALVAQCNGVFNDLAPIRLAAVTDGLSNTMLIAEKSATILEGLGATSPEVAAQRGWYITGNWGDTLMTSLYPPNAYKHVVLGASAAWSDSASSLHPGGVNVLMGDGSARWVGETVQSWPIDALTGNPVGASLTPGGWWAGLQPSGVWQALSTRAGGEVVSSANL